LQPDGTFADAEFLHRIRTIKTNAASWKDYFFTDISNATGS